VFVGEKQGRQEGKKGGVGWGVGTQTREKGINRENERTTAEGLVFAKRAAAYGNQTKKTPK